MTQIAISDRENINRRNWTKKNQHHSRKINALMSRKLAQYKKYREPY